jgi:hypothetical protein
LNEQGGRALFNGIYDGICSSAGISKKNKKFLLVDFMKFTLKLLFVKSFVPGGSIASDGVLVDRKNSHVFPGFYCCIFLFLYGVFRFFCEFLRLPEVFFTFNGFVITVGQILSIFMILVSFILWIYLRYIRVKKCL